MSGGQGNLLFGKGKLSGGPRNVAIDTRNDLISLENVSWQFFLVSTFVFMSRLKAHWLNVNDHLVWFGIVWFGML